MRSTAGKLLITVSVIALAAGGYFYIKRNGEPAPPITMRQTGESTNDGLFVRRRTIDYQTVVREAVAEKASFLTMTLSGDIVRDQDLKTSIKFTPFPDSTARIRVKYHVEYPIGYVLAPGKFRVTGGADALVITLHRPRLIARPSVKLLAYDILESGVLIDEKVALLDLQQRIQPEAERLAKAALKRHDVLPTSERALRGFLTPLLRRAADGADPPPITFEYR
ncbi:hypothetical protein SFC76_08065 [Sphingomonas sp. CD22]|uniref:hypothetical protein n=1 Tax=Sphingomonas sp. CD22 TaxID=3100214 RepID=UPI002ADFF6E9|nr:hypothetical protein [Sphingomonas sp. CD22]MEA1084215.1 hypothetical protein [Sphingomonas sp. CD22]